jgi:hypothetical protein
VKTYEIRRIIGSRVFGASTHATKWGAAVTSDATVIEQAVRREQKLAIF